MEIYWIHNCHLINTGITTNGQELDSSSLKIIFNFEVFLREGIDDENSPFDIPKNFDDINELASLMKIVRSNYKDLLKNPLAEAFLHMKWQLVDKLFYFYFIWYTIFLVILTIMSYIMGEMTRSRSNCTPICTPYPC